MLGILVDLAAMAIELATRKVVRSPWPPVPAIHRRDAMRVEAADLAYRRWAEWHRLTFDDGIRGYRGMLARHRVIVLPGLDGSSPIGVEVEVAIEHGEGMSALLRGPEDATTDIEKSLCKLLSDPALSPELRSVALLGRGVRMRFAAMTAPRFVERGVVEAITVVASLRREAGGAPYR